ncbi:hypothetical protein K435DRAFT_185064 [Dendrothele bispora CBS 962.96]|uniref:Uncharacterized protein n=1 Tax=Dendrothele bispora (strain CBS 962.96) TaxID=1314807 RepID=A0A4S8KKW7_DENBC|nr:hypothetical protein K435DRAFT_185064 [Dendrothele bispora CBS 962.96]
MSKEFVRGYPYVIVGDDNRRIDDSYNTHNTTNTNSNNTYHTNMNSGNYTYNTNTNSGTATYNTNSGNTYNTNTNSGNTYNTNTNSSNAYNTNTNSGNAYNTNTNSHNSTRNTNMSQSRSTRNSVPDYRYEKQSDFPQDYRSMPPSVGRSDQSTVHGPNLPPSQTQYRPGGYVERGYVNYDNTGRGGGEHNPNTNSAYYEEEVDEGTSQPAPQLAYGNARPRVPGANPGGLRCDPNPSQSSTWTGERSSESPRNRYPNNYSGGSQRRDPPHPRSSQDVPPPYPYAPPLSHSASEPYYQHQPSQTTQTSPPPPPAASVPPTDRHSRSQYYPQNASEQGSRPRYSGGSQSGSRSGSMSSKDSYRK